MKKLLFLQVLVVLLVVFAAPSTALAQGLLYDNGPLITHPNQGCGGDHASQITSGLSLFGVNQNFDGPFRIADDFTVTAFGGWQIDSIQFFGYQTGNTTTTSTFTSIRIEIYDGPPDAGGNLIFGDINTNVMINTYYSGINRVSTPLNDCNRRIMVNTANVGTLLPPGTYWLVWAATGSLASGPWQPPITIPGQLVTGNAKQYINTGVWQDILDNGNPQGVPFKIYGTAQHTAIKDIYVQSVTFTPSNPQVGSPVTVSALIRDLGTEPNPASVPMTYKVGAIPAAQGDGVAQTFAPGWAGDSAIVTFTTPYTPTVYGNFTIYVRSFYPGDQVPVNDVASRTAYAQPAVDLALISFLQTSGLPTPEPPSRPGSLPPPLRVGESEALPAVAAAADVVDEAAIGSVGGEPLSSPEALIGVRSIVRNDGFSSSTYTLNWDVDGANQTPYSGPSVAGNGGRDTANLTYNTTSFGTFLTTGRVAAGGDPNAANDTARFRMRVYPSSYVRTIYDRGDNIVNTRIGFGSPTSPIIAAVRYNAAVAQRLRGVDVICQTDSGAGPMTIKVRGEGPNTSTPGPVLFETTVTGPAGSAYFPRTLDYITIPFDSATAPIVSAGQTFWITIAYPTNAPFPGGAHSSGFTPGRSFYSSNDVTFSALFVGTPPVEHAWIMRAYGDTDVPPMAYSSSTTTQNTVRVARNTTNQHIIGIQVVTSGYAPPINITQFNLNTNGTTNTADISNAKIFYTGTSSVFAATNQFGSTVPSPSGSFTITGNQTLQPGTNYFWLTYDIPAGATLGNLVDAECTSITVGGTPQTPTVTAPAGARQISLPLSGTYTVGIGPFNRNTGRNLYHQAFTHRVMREVPVEDAAMKGITEMTASPSVPGEQTRWVEVEEQYSVLMENGNPYTGERFHQYAGVEAVGDFLTLTDAVNTLNALGVSGPVVFLLTDPTYPSETFPITIHITNVNALPNATNTVTIKPAVGVTPLLSGAASNGPILRILNTNFVIIDGSNTTGGSTRDWTISNTSTASPNVIHIGSLGTTPVSNITVKNCNLINGAQTSSAVVVSDGSTIGSAGYFSNIVIQNNSIRKAYIGVYANGGTSPQQGSNLSCIGNSLDASGANAIRYIGLYMQGVNGATVRGNTIGNFDGANGENDRGIWIASGTINAVVEKNLIHHLQYTGTAGWAAHGITVSSAQATSNVLVKNNMIHTISGDGWDYTAILADNPIGIFAFGTQGGVKIYNNSIHLYGNTLNQANALSMGIALGTGTTADLRNNIVVNNLGLLAAVGHGTTGVFLQTAVTQLAVSNYNDYWVAPSGSGVKAIGKVGTTNYLTLAAWRTATGQEANSISEYPYFVSPTNLHCQPGSPVDNAGVPLADVTDDFDGDPRSPTTPDIGADEFSSTVTINVALNAGWNMISNPVTRTPGTDSVRHLYPNSMNPYVFAYVPGAGYEQRFVMPNRQGFWGKFATAHPNPITGNARLRDSIPVASGWNMVGSISHPVDTSTITSNPPGIRASNWFGYSGGYIAVAEITPGYGYWVKASAAGKFYFQLSSTGVQPKTSPVTDPLAELNTLTITDAEGGSQTLYFGPDPSGAIQVTMYEMPPAPPQGVFDARFISQEGGFMLQTHASELTQPREFLIAVQSIAYPLTLTWKIGEDGESAATYELSDALDGSVLGRQTLRGEGRVIIHNPAVSRLKILVSAGAQFPKEFALSQNYPNPFNPSTSLRVDLPAKSRVTVEVFNILGQRVRTLLNEERPAGYHVVEWDSRTDGGQLVGSGVYFVRMSAANETGTIFSDVRKIMMLK